MKAFRQPLDGACVVVGSMNVDYTMTVRNLPRAGQTVMGDGLKILRGGKSGNQAVSASLLGAKVVMLGMVGDDTNGDYLINGLADKGVDVNRIGRSDCVSGATLIAVDDAGENTIIVSPGANSRITREYVDMNEDVFENARVAGFCLESPIEVTAYAMGSAKRHDCMTILNYSPYIPANHVPETLIHDCDVLLVNEREAYDLAGMNQSEPWDALYERLADLGFRTAIMTMGGQGSVILNDGTIIHIPAVNVTPVDTTGCGDAYMGAILAGLASNLTLQEAAELATQAGAYATLRHGAQNSYGTLEEIRKTVDSRDM